MEPTDPWHAHIYYQPQQRSVAAALRERMLLARAGDPFAHLLFVGSLCDGKAGPHYVAQFEVHFTAQHLAPIEEALAQAGLTVLVHPLTLDDLADHTSLGRWHGEQLDLDLSVLDPPGVNQGLARFGQTDF